MSSLVPVHDLDAIWLAERGRLALSKGGDHVTLLWGNGATRVAFHYDAARLLLATGEAWDVKGYIDKRRPDGKIESTPRAVARAFEIDIPDDLGYYPITFRDSEVVGDFMPPITALREARRGGWARLLSFGSPR